MEWEKTSWQWPGQRVNLESNAITTRFDNIIDLSFSQQRPNCNRLLGRSEWHSPGLCYLGFSYIDVMSPGMLFHWTLKQQNDFFLTREKRNWRRKNATNHTIRVNRTRDLLIHESQTSYWQVADRRKPKHHIPSNFPKHTLYLILGQEWI